jgi:hypothetical protein
MKNLRIISALIAVAAVIGIWIAMDGRKALNPAPRQDVASRVAERNQSPAAPTVTVVEKSPFNLEYGMPSGSVVKDLEIVERTLADARLLVKDHYRIPLADNRDFTRFLSGGNSHAVAWIRPGHPKINAAGELTDRWGSPIIFHQETSNRTSVRSAGPDLKPWTADDLASPLRSAEVGLADSHPSIANE